MRTFTRILGIAAIATLIGIGGITAAAQDDGEGPGYTVQGALIAPILDAEGNQLGLVAYGEDGTEVGGVVVLQGLTPGEHGIHLHQTGVCDPAGEKAFDSASSHFNPGGMTHPLHAGDLGNLTVDANGNVVFMFGSGTWTLDDGAMGLADADGSAIVVHETVDDLVTDPSGNSGARIACAVLFAPQA